MENVVQPITNDDNPVEIVAPTEVDDHPTPIPENTEIYDFDEKEKTFREKCYIYAELFRPRLYLYIFLISYILIGAAYFHHYESIFEIESRNLTFSEFMEFRNDFLNKTRALSFTTESSDNIKQKELFDTLILHFFRIKNSRYFTEEYLLNAKKENDELIWSYSNSVFFATTVLTTIGYGNKLAPQTFYGKIGVIIFGIFGIPLLMFTVWDIAKNISDFILWGYEKYYDMKKQIFYKINGIQLSSLKTDEDEDRFITLSFESLIFMFTVFIVINGLILKLWKGGTYLDSVYNCFNTVATIGFGNA